MSNTDLHVKVLTHVADTISAGAILGTFVGLLPPLAAFVATIWYLVQIWESATVQKWVRLHARKRRTYHALKRHNRLVRKAIHRVKPPGV